MPSGEENLALEIRFYGDKAGTFMLYDDDGISFNYEQGAYSWTELKVEPDGDIYRPSMKVSNKEHFSYSLQPEWVFMTK